MAARSAATGVKVDTEFEAVAGVPTEVVLVAALVVAWAALAGLAAA